MVYRIKWAGIADVFVYDKEFVPDSVVVPPSPSKIEYAAETGDGYVPVRSGVRGWYAWKDTMAKVGQA